MGQYAMLIPSHADLSFIKPQIYVIEYLLLIILELATEEEEH